MRGPGRGASCVSRSANAGACSPPRLKTRRDAVARVDAKLATRVFVRVRARLEALHVRDVRVRGDEAGHDELARKIDHALARRWFLAGTDADDLAVTDENRRGLGLEST